MKTLITTQRVLLLIAAALESYMKASELRTLSEFRSILGPGPTISHRIAWALGAMVLVVVGLSLEFTWRRAAKYFNPLLYGFIAAFNLVVAVSARSQPEAVSVTLGPGLAFLVLAVGMAILYRRTSGKVTVA